MSEQQSPPPSPPSPPQQRTSAFDRLFPGPRENDPTLTARLQEIRRTAQQRSAAHQQRGMDRRQNGGRTAGLPAAESDELLDAIHELTEVSRALLEAEVAVRDDARATAQNSRTFAVAGTAIAFFTMVAAVVTVVIAFLQ